MNNLIKIRRSHAWIVTLLLLFPSVILLGSPPPQGKLTGELWVTGAANVNGKRAANGMTVLPGSRIQTGPESVAAVNLDQLGRASLHTDTDFTLDFKANAIAGNLAVGTVVIDIPRGVAVNVTTPNREVVVPVDQTPTTLTVEVTAEGTHSFICCKRDQDRIRAVRPVASATGVRSGWLLPLLIVTGLGVGAILAVALLDSSNVSATVLPDTPNVTPVTPGLIILSL